ncbi:MAG: hypothetical protein AABY11_01470, partial [archaeon]
KEWANGGGNYVLYQRIGTGDASWFIQIDCDSFLTSLVNTFEPNIEGKTTVTFKDLLNDCEADFSSGNVEDLENENGRSLHALRSNLVAGDQLINGLITQGLYFSPVTANTKAQLVEQSTETTIEQIPTCTVGTNAVEITLTNNTKTTLQNSISPTGKFPQSLIFKENNVQKYLLNIKGYGYVNKEVSMIIELCHRENNGFTRAWKQINVESTGKKTIVMATPQEPFTIPVTLSNVAEIKAQFREDYRGDVTVSFFLKDTSPNEIEAITVDATDDQTSNKLRIKLSSRAAEAIIEKTKIADSPNELLNQMNGNITPKNGNPSLLVPQKAEGLLSVETNVQYDEDYFTVTGASPGTYELTLTIGSEWAP